MSEEALFALLGEIEAPENELDDERDTYEDAYDKYDFLNFVNSVGTPDFKDNYLILKNRDIRVKAIENIARELVDKVDEVYGITLFVPDSPTLAEVMNIFLIVEFLEYKYVDLWAKLWSYLTDNFRAIEDIADTYEWDSAKLIEVIDDIVESYDLHTCVKNLLLTLNKEAMLKLFIDLTKKRRLEILVAMESEI